MSNMFSYNDDKKTHEEAMRFDPLTSPNLQIYAIKYILGLLDRERRILQRVKSKKENTSYFEARIAMLKQLAGTIARLPIPAESQNQKQGEA